MTSEPTRRSAVLVDELADEIESRVLTGIIPIGSWLRQEHLAEEFGVSRTPVREAIRKLQAAGIVEHVPHRGALVSGPTLRDVLEAYVVRALLEGLAAELAASRIDDGGLEALTRVEALFEREMRTFPGLDSSERVIRDALLRCDRTNSEFHDAVHAAADNARLRRAIHEVHPTFPRALMILPLVQEAALVEENIGQHRAILTALAARDAARARAATLDHVHWAGDLVARWFERRSAPLSPAP